MKALGKIATLLVTMACALPAIAQSDETAKRFHVFPQLADGGGWISLLLVTNVSQSSSFCTFELHGMSLDGCVATFKNQQESDWLGRLGSVSCSHLEQLVDELNLLPNIRTAHPPRLPLQDCRGVRFQPALVAQLFDIAE